MMEILNIIVHEVQKGEKVNPRAKENTIDDKAQELASYISGLFNKAGVNIGQFVLPEENNDEKPVLEKRLNTYFKHRKFSNFVEFTQKSSESLKKHLDKTSAGKGGFLLFIHYSHGKDHFLTIILLRNKAGLSISDKLILEKIQSLDLDKLHMAARINLTRWKKTGDDKYIWFKIGKSAKEVRDYFADFIGCKEFKKTAVDTRNLIKTTTAYCKQHKLSKEDSEDIRTLVKEHCLENHKKGTSVSLSNISTMLDAKLQLEEEQDKGQFIKIAQNVYELSEDVIIDKTVLKGLTRYSGSTKSLSISFDSSLLEKTIHFDKKTGKLRIDQIPQELDNQLRGLD